jgi:hypothetical protein
MASTHPALKKAAVDRRRRALEVSVTARRELEAVNAILRPPGGLRGTEVDAAGWRSIARDARRAAALAEALGAFADHAAAHLESRASAPFELNGIA